MKRLTIFAGIGVLIVGFSFLTTYFGKYGSRVEASRAAAAYRKDKRRIEVKYGPGSISVEEYTKSCVDEEITRKIVCHEVNIRSDMTKTTRDYWESAKRNYTYFRY